jgi:hypothetical protein
MKQLLLIAATLLAFAFGLSAQSVPVKFGKFSDEEIKMQQYAKDTSAIAVVLADFGMAEIIYLAGTGFQLRFSKHRRVKILKTEGLDLAKETIGLYRNNSGNRESLSSIKASTYNLENGKLVETKFAKKDLISEEESKNVELKKLVFPNVKVGSIIEYDYEITSPFFRYLRDWYFQDEIPVLWSELRTQIPEFFDYKSTFGGYLRADTNDESTMPFFIAGNNTSYRTIGRRIIYKDLPAFRDEKFIKSKKDYLARIEFELRSTHFPNSFREEYSTTWNNIAKNLMEDENFGLALNRHGIVKELTEKINKSDNEINRAKAALNLLRGSMTWDESYGIFTRTTLREAFNKNKGNMAEINLLLVNLLRSVDIDAHPVVFSTRAHGSVRMFYPNISAFNGVLACAKIDGKNLLIDATLAFTNPGELSPSYINGQGMKIANETIEWIPLINEEQYNITSLATLKFEDDKCKADVVQTSNKSSALYLRGRIASKGKEQYIDGFKKNTSDWDITDYVIENEIDYSKPLVEKITVENFNHIDASGDMIYIPAMISAEKETNPFSSETRLYPVEFAVPVFERHYLNIIVPEGYTVEELPKDLKLSIPNDAASFIYMAKLNNNYIQVYSTFKLTKTLYSPSEYMLLKQFYTNMIAKHGEQIVLKKSNQ